jgi:dTDP-4-dehydrorhamnose reductase
MTSSVSSNFRVLVVGSKGMLARDLLTRLRQGGLQVEGLDLPELDITRFGQVHSSIGSSTPGVVINCAAYTSVDKAESERDAAFSVNRDGPANLADACMSFKIPLIHISTDYVFDGRAHVPYREDAQPNPLGVYGKSKWEGEEAIRRRLREHIIVRTAWLFGAHGRNFPKTILELAREREELRVIADQRGCPTWTGDLADALTKMTTEAMRRENDKIWGTYHFCGSGLTTWHGFAESIIRNAMNREALRTRRVVPITTDEYPTPTRRPAWSVLDCRKVGRVFGIVPPDWQIGLAKMMDELYHEKQVFRSTQSGNT